MAEEATGGCFVHSSAAYILIVLALADGADLWICGLWVHEYHSAYAGVRKHCITFGQLDAEALAAACAAVTMMTMLMMTMLVMTM